MRLMILTALAVAACSSAAVTGTYHKTCDFRDGVLIDPDTGETIPPTQCTEVVQETPTPKGSVSDGGGGKPNGVGVDAGVATCDWKSCGTNHDTKCLTVADASQLAYQGECEFIYRCAPESFLKSYADVSDCVYQYMRTMRDPSLPWQSKASSCDMAEAKRRGDIARNQDCQAEALRSEWSYCENNYVPNCP
jgi:hypothetical protein